MDADAWRKPSPTTSHSLPPSQPPPALFRARSGRVADLVGTGTGAGAAFLGPPDTPPRRSYVTVPFIWEDAPGKPKLAPSPLSPTATNAGGHVPDGGGVPEGGEHQDSGGHNADHQAGHPRPLKLPPRLQKVPLPAASFATAAEYTPSPSPSPKTVLHGPGPYHGWAAAGGGAGSGRSRSKPPKWVRSGGAALRRTPSAGVALLSRTFSKRKAPGAVAPASASSKNRGGDHERDGPWCSPASSDSSSSVSTRFRPADGREAASSEEDDDDGSPRTSVRFTRTFTRNRSLPNMSTSNLWASVRKSVKHITPILHGARNWATTRYGH